MIFVALLCKECYKQKQTDAIDNWEKKLKRVNINQIYLEDSVFVYWVGTTYYTMMFKVKKMGISIYRHFNSKTWQKNVLAVKSLSGFEIENEIQLQFFFHCFFF